jgi:hypothetical protein
MLYLWASRKSCMHKTLLVMRWAAMALALFPLQQGRVEHGVEPSQSRKTRRNNSPLLEMCACSL